MFKLFSDLADTIIGLFETEPKYLPDIGKLLMCNQYESVYAYIKGIKDKARLKRELTKAIKRSLNEKLHKLYKFKCDLYKFIFDEQSKFFNQKWYDTSDNFNDDVIAKLYQIKQANG